MSRPYKAKSITGAQARVRLLERRIEWYGQQHECYIQEYCEMRRKLKLLAKLAANGPAFDNPLAASEAERVRDEILAQMGMNPDGSFQRRAR